MLNTHEELGSAASHITIRCVDGMDVVLKKELGPMYVGLRKFHETYFGDVADLKTASETVFKKCMEAGNPLFDEGWSGWPEDAHRDDVLTLELACGLEREGGGIRT